MISLSADTPLSAGFFYFSLFKQENNNLIKIIIKKLLHFVIVYDIIVVISKFQPPAEKKGRIDMDNENVQKSALAEGIALVDKSLDTMIAGMRREAHQAIDMDDWNKAEEILARTKGTITAVEGLKAKFAEFKAEVAKLGFVEESKANETVPAVPKPSEQVKPAEVVKPSAPVATKPAEQPKPAEVVKPSAPVAPKPAEQPKPAEVAKSSAPVAPKPAEQPKPAEVVKPSAPVAPKPAEQPKPAEVAKPSAPAPKPVEQAKPASDVRTNADILDLDMSDVDPPRKPQNPIIEACEDFITKFPFSMRLIYSNDKIGRFFTTDDIIAKNDMSKPVQLTNGLWVETNIPEERIQAFIRGVKRYCEESVSM